MKIPRNSVEILSNTCLYNIFETYFSYWSYLLAVNLQIYLGTSSLKCANNVPKLPGVDYVVKNWALALMLKALPLVVEMSVTVNNSPFQDYTHLDNHIPRLHLYLWHSLIYHKSHNTN